MIDSNKNEESEERNFADAYAYFMRELKTLAEDAEAQCFIKQYYNVAWELRYFGVGAIEAILRLPGGRFSVEQREGVLRLLEYLNSIPDAVVNVGNQKEAHRCAMKDPAWSPVRIHAKNLIPILDSESERIDAIINPLD